MEAVEFKAKIKDGSLQIPSKYQGKFKDSVRVILMTDDADTRQGRVDSLFDAAERLAALNEPVLSDTELEAEIAAARKARVRK